MHSSNIISGKIATRAVLSILGRIAFLSLFFTASVFPLTTAAVQAAQVTLTLSGGVSTNSPHNRLYYGTASRNYAYYVDMGGDVSETVTGLQAGTTYYFAATNYDAKGIESAYSNEVSFVAPSECTYTISPTSQSFAAAGGTGSVGVTTQSGCAWTASGSSWITITSGASGTGSGTVKYSVPANTGATRTAAASIAGRVLTVTQTGVQSSMTITASAGTGGAISPTGATSVTYGSSKTFTITPATGYSVSAVTVDGASVGAVTSYTFSNVTANHTIAATFAATQSSRTITASAGTGGTISPSGATSVANGSSKTFTITPASSYSVATVTVDGASVGAVTSYTFSNVTANHTVAATFAAQSGMNVARLATVTASSQNTSTGQTAAKAVDGYTDGYPSGTYTHEWATVRGKAGTWIQLTWPTAQSVKKIALYDRPNTSDRITAGTITFSDGSRISIGSLDNTGAAKQFTFTTKKITSLRLTITGVSSTTANVGLAEIQVYN